MDISLSLLLHLKYFSLTVISHKNGRYQLKALSASQTYFSICFLCAKHHNSIIMYFPKTVNDSSPLGAPQTLSILM